jgi:hypothetical protein
MKKMMRSTFGRLFNKNWVLVATLCICGASAFTSCSNNDDNPVVDNSLAEKIVGKWIHADTDGETVTTDMKSVYTFTKNGSALKGFYSMSKTDSGVWAYRQETDLTISGNTITMTSRLADGQQSVVELTAVTVSGDDLRFTAKTTLSKDGQVTAPCSASAGKSRDRKDGTRTGKSSPARAARWSIRPSTDAPTAPLTPSPRT